MRLPKPKGCVGGSPFPDLLVMQPVWAWCPVLVTLPDKNVAQQGLDQEVGIYLASSGEEKARVVPHLFSAH